jgi:AcrR family transcriptional regulator
MTFYRHFNSKDEVIESYLEALHQKFLEEVVHKNRFASYIQYENMLLAFQNVQEHSRYVEYIIKNNMGEILMRKLIENELNLSLRSQKTEEDRYLSIAYASAIYGVIVNWVREGMTTSPETLARLLINLYQDKIKRY